MAQPRGTVPTELEGAVLGCLDRLGPCTAYRVRVTFAQSPSRVWSGSAGAIYPLLRRLERRGLVRSRKTQTGRKAGLEYSLTAAGQAAHRAWVADAVAAADPGFDPLRTRGLSLGALPAAKRRRFLAEVWVELEGQRDRLRARIASGENSPETDRADRSVILQIEAKLKWLAEIE